MVAKDWVWHAPKCLEHVLKGLVPRGVLWRSDKIAKRWSLVEDVQVNRGHLKGHYGDIVTSSFSALSDLSREQFSSATYFSAVAGCDAPPQTHSALRVTKEVVW